MNLTELQRVHVFSSPSPAYLGSSPSLTGQDSSPSPSLGLESESNKIGTRVQLESESKDLRPHLWTVI